MTTMSDIVRAMEAAYASIRANHDELPDVIVVVGPDKGSARGKLGHWAKDSWVVGEGSDRAHELLVTAEHLDRGAVDVFETLLHEAAHALATARDQKDHAGQRHNGLFRANAQELGLNVEKQGNRGWAHTSLKPETVELYAGAIAGIGAALTGYRRPVTVARDPDKAAKAKTSSAKSMTRWLAASDAQTLVETLAGVENADEILAGLARELGAACANCGVTLAPKEES